MTGLEFAAGTPVCRAVLDEASVLGRTCILVFKVLIPARRLPCRV